MNYYNEHDPKAAAWLRELIRGGHIAAGEVDERDIRTVPATDLVGYRQCHFFAGIGGWSLALRLAGWPDDEPVWTGSCPCQPFSAAGKQMGNDDPRHLWPAFRRLIHRGTPAIVFGEQVASAAGRQWLAGVRANLETMGYAVGAADLCAAGVGAPHIRQRLWWVGHAHGEQADAAKSRQQMSGARRGDPLRDGRTAGGIEGVDSGGLADDIEHGRLSRSGDERETPGARIQHGHDLERRGGNGRLEHAAIDGREQRRAESGGGSVVRGCESGRLADVQQPGLEGHAGHGDDGDEPGRLGTHAAGSTAESDRAGAGFWSDFELIPCADGKARRIEPGTFPLAHGVSGRVGLLRGYGNAIVPEVAAEFIRAYREAVGRA